MKREQERTTIALEYKYPYGVVNPVWAASRRYKWFPDRIILFTPDAGGRLAVQTRAMLEAFQKRYLAKADVQLQEADQDDFDGIREDAQILIEKERDAGRRVAVDVTAGRTIPKLALYRAALAAQPDHVFYLNVRGYDYRPEPYPLVPARIQRCQDLLLKEVMDHGD